MIAHQTLTAAQLEPYETYSECTIAATSLPGKVSDVTLDNCTLTGIWSQSEWLDCTFQNLNLANQDWNQAVLYRCHFQGCNLLGTNFSNGVWKTVRLADCRADYANWSGAQLTACAAQTTSLREAYFRDVTFKRGFVATQCDLDQASFWESPLAGVDLAASTFEQLEVTPEAKYLRGLVLNALQAATVLSLFGVRLK